MELTRDLLDKLACPKCRGPVERIPEPPGLACRACDLLYPIVDGIPNFIVSEARPAGPR